MTPFVEYVKRSSLLDFPLQHNSFLFLQDTKTNKPKILLTSNFQGKNNYLCENCGGSKSGLIIEYIDNANVNEIKHAHVEEGFNILDLNTILELSPAVNLSPVMLNKKDIFHYYLQFINNKKDDLSKSMSSCKMRMDNLLSQYIAFCYKKSYLLSSD